MNILKKNTLFFTVVLVGCLCFNVTPVVHGFIPKGNSSVPLSEYKTLMQKVHEPQWIIGYRYGAECTPEERQNGAALQEAMTLALRTWLEPLKKLDTERPIVDKFVYVLQPDFHFVQYGDTYNRDNPDEDLKAWREVDLRVNFVCMTSASGRFVGGYAGVGDRLPPAIVILDGTKLTPWMISVISHEFGHAFGLSDTYRTDRLPSEGGLDSTAGTQPASAMSGLYESRKAHSITEDDARGIIWVYNYLYKGLTTKNCFFADYVYVKIQGRLGSCAPKYPLIFETKYNPPGFALQILKDDPSIDINAQDASGMTALHYAVLYNKMEVVKALLAHKDIKPLLRNKDGDTPYDIALATGHEEFLKMLPAPPRRKEDVNDDGVINILDLVAVAAQFGQENAGNADINGDGQVNIQDLVAVAAALGEGAATPAAQTTAIHQ